MKLLFIFKLSHPEELGPDLRRLEGFLIGTVTQCQKLTIALNPEPCFLGAETLEAWPPSPWMGVSFVIMSRSIVTTRSLK